MQHNITHAEMVAKLIKSGAVIKREISEIDCRFLHAIIGIVGELGELLGGLDIAAGTGQPIDRDNILEELGDLEFFLEDFRTMTCISREETLTCPTVCIIPGSKLRMAVHMLVYGTDLMDAIKKHVIYRKNFDMIRESLVVNLSKIEYILSAFRKQMGFTYEQAIEHNMNKLSVRYKNFEYSNEQAQARADKQS